MFLLLSLTSGGLVGNVTAAFTAKLLQQTIIELKGFAKCSQKLGVKVLKLLQRQAGTTSRKR